jgi:PncC family amidohydrolase
MYIKKLILLLNKIKKKNLKLAIAESCTGGLISNKIIKINGASAFFNTGIICYSNESKINILKIKKYTIKKFGAVSKETCKEMTKNILKIGNANVSIATTGIAGPGGGSKNKPVGLVYIGIGTKKKIRIYKFKFNKHFGRKKIQHLTFLKSIFLLNKNI